MIHGLCLKPKHLHELQGLLEDYLPEIEVWAYGSRVRGDNYEGSDLDLVLRSPALAMIPQEDLQRFKEALYQSRIPILVDVLDWAKIPARFRREIEREYVVLRKPAIEP